MSRGYKKFQDLEFSFEKKVNSSFMFFSNSYGLMVVEDSNDKEKYSVFILMGTPDKWEICNDTYLSPLTEQTHDKKQVTSIMRKVQDLTF